MEESINILDSDVFVFDLHHDEAATSPYNNEELWRVAVSFCISFCLFLVIC